MEQTDWVLDLDAVSLGWHKWKLSSQPMIWRNGASAWKNKQHNACANCFGRSCRESANKRPVKAMLLRHGPRLYALAEPHLLAARMLKRGPAGGQLQVMSLFVFLLGSDASSSIPLACLCELKDAVPNGTSHQFSRLSAMCRWKKANWQALPGVWL